MNLLNKHIENIEQLENEYDLQKASVLDRKLRLMIEENPGLKPFRQKIRKLIKNYEDKHWSEIENIPDSQIEDSEKSEEIVEAEMKFIERRKEIIRKKLREFDMTQQDLGLLLGHPKSYISELMNGVSHFTMKDLVIIHRIFDIDIKYLIPTYLQSETRDKVRESIKQLNKPKLRLKRTELI